MAHRVLIISAEASSALYARRLLEAWRKHDIKVSAFGVGDQKMLELGFRALGRSEDMAVVGIKEVLRHYSHIKKVFYDILAECDLEKPKFALLLDYPDFNFRLAKELKKRGIRVIYYISPQLWAWRKGRLSLVKKYIDKMLVLFPFEKDFYRENGVEVEFVGHPLLDELRLDPMSQEKRAEYRARIGVSDNDQLVGLLPGSRRSEIEQHMALMIRSAEKIHSRFPSTKFAVLVAPGVSVDFLKSCLPPYDFPLLFMEDDPVKMTRLLDFAICASGTATLVLGLAACPMVVVYRMKALTAWVARRFVKGVKHFAMVNLILGEEVVPELFQEKANEEEVFNRLSVWLSDPKAAQNTRAKLEELKTCLGQSGATENVLAVLKEEFQ